MASLSWKITNATSAKPKNLVLINVTTDEVLPAVFFYGQDLSLIQPSSTITSIKPGEYQTFPVPEAKKDSAGNAVPYTFIIAVAETLAPIASVTCNATASDLADLTITDAMITSIDIVTDFIQNITAFPASDLAVDFVKVMDGGTESQIKAFFATTKGYKAVKIDDLHLVQSYYKALPYGWANGKNTKFYLYGKDYKNNSDTDEPIAELNITNDWKLPLAATPDTKNFKIELTTYDDKKKTTLVFQDGVFWDSVTTDTPKIALAGSFIMPSQLTLDNSRNEIEAYLMGNMYGYTVFGFDEKAPHDQDAEGGFMEAFAVHNFKEGLDLAMYFLSIPITISAFVTAYYFGKYIKNKFRSDDTLETIKKTDEIKELIRVQNEEIAAKLSPKIKTIEARTTEQVQRELKQAMRESGYRFAKINLQDMVQGQLDSLRALGNRQAGQGIQDVVDGLDLIQVALDGNGIANLITDDVTTTLQGYNVVINRHKAAVDAEITAAQKKSFKDAQQAYDESLAFEKVNEERIADWEAGEDADEIEVEVEVVNI